MTTPEHAIDLCHSVMGAQWEHGTFTTGDVRENEEFYLVPYGNAEFLEAGDRDYMLLDSPMFLVRKSTGVPSTVPRAGNTDLFLSFKRLP